MLNADDKIKYDKIYEIYRTKIFNYACKITKDILLAEEITIIVLLKLYNKKVLHKLRDITSFDTIKYIAKMTKNVCLKETKRKDS